MSLGFTVSYESRCQLRISPFENSSFAWNVLLASKPPFGDPVPSTPSAHPLFSCVAYGSCFFTYSILKLSRILQLVANEFNQDWQVRVRLVTSVFPCTKNSPHSASFISPTKINLSIINTINSNTESYGIRIYSIKGLHNLFLWNVLVLFSIFCILQYKNISWCTLTSLTLCRC